MSGISAAGGISSIQVQTAYDARVASLQKDAVEQQGREALKLIQSAGSAGKQLDISI